nr:unnamed protein product [uncultured Mediterranean phage uvMED]BAR26666.1 unnamed protein product [uncultured Mediterranean phage uvMED]BAR26736.1 unnamed protein product [uncultured Mediterranean phage uvMED]BAR26785.1 unnamed protein product [uncultured Mediterranean phage uvMED]BAR26808.1 unnamed protein product [uncultured Mediterranean phage uvMED]|tara:strand:- start:77 stop:427 length:351 start_codon:yes stop_codon:yes gene_type:complete
MAFILDDLDDTFEWQVKLLIPTKNKRRTETFNGIFKRISQERYNEIARLQDEEAYSNEDVVREIMIGWTDMQDKEGNELPFTITRLNKLLDVFGVAGYILKAFGEAYTGGLKRKNF